MQILGLSLVTCECGYPRASGFACTSCTRFDHLPPYRLIADSGVSDDTAALQTWENDGGAL